MNSEKLYSCSNGQVCKKEHYSCLIDSRNMKHVSITTAIAALATLIIMCYYTISESFLGEPLNS